jgi:hypothetical protein
MKAVFVIATLSWSSLLVESLWAGWKMALRTNTGYLSDGQVLLFVGAPLTMLALTASAWVLYVTRARKAVDFASDTSTWTATVGFLSLVLLLPYLVVTSVL